jgi:hypothetical protein
MKQKHLTVDEDIHRRIEVIATLKRITMKDVVTEAVKNYEIKHRLTDEINGIIR